MALIVENGTGLANAESYISVVDATTYHANRGNAAWAALDSDTVREQALRKATDYMEQVYRLQWKGSRVTNTQALSWPRYDVEREDGSGWYASDAVPNEVKNACAELALKASADDLSPDLGQGIIREKIDVIEVEYDKNSPQYTQYRAVNNMLAPLLNGLSGAFRKVIRT
jgi:hypothetical protein